MKTWKIQVTISVADSWVTDGFDMADRMDVVEDSLRDMLPYAYDHEIKITTKILSAPDPKQVAALQNGDMEPKD